MFFVAIIGIFYAKLEKIDDAVAGIQVDVAVIKQQVGIKNVTTLLDRMFK